MDDADLAQKLQRLEETDDPIERNSLALELEATRDPRVFDSLIRLIQRPDLENHRGTLVYCLESYDCSSVFKLLEGLALTGNFEVAAQAEIILQEQGGR